MEEHLMEMLRDLETLNAENKGLRASEQTLREKLQKAKKSFKLQMKDLQKHHKSEIDRLKNELNQKNRPAPINPFDVSDVQKSGVLSPGYEELITDLKQKLENQKAECNRLTASNNELTQKAEKLEKRIESLLKENKKLLDLNNEWELNGQKESEQLLQFHLDHEKQIGKMKEEFKREREDLIQKFKAELSTLKSKQNNSMQSSGSIANEKIPLLEKENQNLRSELRFYQQRLKINDQEVKALQKQIDEYHDIIANLKNLIARLENEIKGSSQIGPGTKLSMLDELKTSMTFLNIK